MKPRIMDPMRKKKISKYLPPTNEQWNQLPQYIKWQLFMIAICESISSRKIIHPPIHISILATFYSFGLLAIMPHHPLAIPTAIGAGLSGAIITTGGIYAKPISTE
jgi:hypothetical protein